MNDSSGRDPRGACHLLEVRGLHVHYRDVCALRDVSFRLECGRAVALLGANGAGKSTLIKALAGLVKVGEGEMLWSGQPLGRHRAAIAYLPQQERIDWRFPLTVAGLVEMGRFPQVGWFGRFGADDRRSVDAAIAVMGLESLRDRQIGELSGGQQQRAFLARALAQEAHVLLLDEPFTGLDAPSRETLTGLIRTVAARGHLVIASHHDLAGAAAVFDEAILLDRRLVCHGPVEAVVAGIACRAA